MMDSLTVPQIDISSSTQEFTTFGTYRVVLLGDPKVGKTSIMRRMTGGNLPDQYTPTVDENITQSFLLGAQEVTVVFTDTSGSSDFPAMKQLAIEKADIVLLVFALDDIKSYENVLRYRDEVVAIKSDEIPIIVIANKTDLEDPMVDPKEADFYLCFERHYGFVAMSAKCDPKVRPLFNEILKKVRIPSLPNLEKVDEEYPKKTVTKTSSLPLIRAGSFKRHKKVERRVSCHLQ